MITQGPKRGNLDFAKGVSERGTQMIRLSIVMMTAALALSACGSSTGDRTLSGAGIGAGAGAVVGAVTGLTIVQGAVIGAAAGGLTGALTDEDSIDLGKPFWE